MKPAVVFAGFSVAPFSDDSTVTYHEREGYVRRLVDDRVSLVLVNGQDTHWRFWATTPKTSPATRRIPVIVFSDDPPQRQEILLAGADVALPFNELTPQVIKDYARIVDFAVLEQLDRDCQNELPEEALRGIEKFNAGEFYQQHDLFEALWMATESPVRELYRAILQVGIGYYQIHRGNYRGAVKMLLRSVQWLAMLPDVCQGVDVAQLRADSARIRAELERLGEANFHEFDHRLLQPVKRIENPPLLG